LCFWIFFIIIIFCVVAMPYLELEVEQFFCGGCALFGAGDRPVFGVGGDYATERQTDTVVRKGQLEGLEFVRSCHGGLVKKN
jgi:hypothetical protein